MIPQIVSSIIIVASWAGPDTALDTFGIVKFYPTKAGTREWNSAHWNNGIARTFTYAPDPYDPTGWTEDHSASTDGFRVDGRGVMAMSGGGPRFHINSLISSKVPAQRFSNVEYTAYSRHLGTAGANWGGMVVGQRSGPLGHGSPGGNDCDATTYYARFRNDGKWDFEKELKHPNSTYWSGSGISTQDPLWHGSVLPRNRWIGMKYITFNIKNDAQVRLVLYIDSVSGNTPRNGGHWDKVGEVVDSGAWPAGDVSGCSFSNRAVITAGGGTLLMRTDNDTALYTMVTIREIDANGGLRAVPRPGTRASANAVRIRSSGQGMTVFLGAASGRPTNFALFDVQGRRTYHGKIRAGADFFFLPQITSGMHVIRVGDARDGRIFPAAQR